MLRTQHQTTITNAVKCVVRECTVTIKTATGDTQVVDVDRLILNETSAYHTPTETMYEFDYPMNLSVTRIDGEVVVANETV